MSLSSLYTAAKSAQSPVIMVVDDDFAARLQMRFSLENNGFTVVEAESGLEAITYFKKAHVDLVLLDVIMPEIDGLETCREMRGLPGGRHTPIVMITGLEDPETITHAFDAGATDFISKPLNLLILGYRVRYWLRSGAILNELQLSQKRLFRAQDIARLGHWEKDLNDGDFQITCHTPQMIGLSASCSYEDLFLAIVSEDKDKARKTIDDACAAELSFSVQYRIALQDGSERIILNQGEVVRRGNPQKRHVVGIIQDITALKQAEDRIRYLAFYDNLTGLANRALFREHSLKLLPQAKRNHRKAAVVFIDLDHFKRINDTLGYSSGDKSLITVAERLKNILRHSDAISRPGDEDSNSILSRVGGDEFNILIADIHTADQLANLTERIIDTLATPLYIDGQQIILTASIGVSVYPDDGEDIDTLLKNADTAMYEAKEKGRNNYQFFQNAMNEAALARFHMSNSLRKALNSGEFVLYYQPQYANTNGCRLTGMEALIRWIDPVKGLIPPDAFLPFAEESGFIHSINDWVIQEACKQAKQWVDAGLFAGCRMGINVSGNNINFQQLVAKISRTLQETGLSPMYLEVELTERVMMTNTDEARLMLLQLREMGVAIAIDDFGTGYSALSHLQLFPLSTLKIDKSFVQNIGKSENGLSLVQSIVDIAKSFNLKVVAEGVETEEQKEALGRMKCDELQGYLLSRPVPMQKLEELLKMET